jgi:hypothetical protein
VDGELVSSTLFAGDVNPIMPTEAQQGAANNQSEFYAAEWEKSRQNLLTYYIGEFDCTNGTCLVEAFERSLAEATGSEMCGSNKGASAW